MSDMARRTPALRVKGITKRFGSLTANDGIDLEIDAGEVLGILGENGAGKSTLMNILYGLLSADEGTIEINGEQVNITDPSVALEHGVGMVHQHFMLIPAFTVVENLVLGAEPSDRGLIDRRGAVAAVREVSERFGLDVDPHARVEDLGVAARQRVEILRALYRGARVLILDEPTAVLSPLESNRLFGVLGSMVREGMAIVLISHKLHELLTVTNRITVLRDGKVIDTVSTSEADERMLATLMVGRATKLELDTMRHADIGEVRLSAAGVKEESGLLKGIDLEVRAGEIVGIAGVDGSGQTELTETLAGIRRVASGSVQLDGADVTRLSAAQRLESGLAFVPDDRTDEGLVRDMSVYENAILRRQRRPSLRRWGFLSPSAARGVAQKIVTEHDVRPPRVDLHIRNLSGGNQQKLMMGRELSEEAGVLIVCQPTRGVDIAATQAIRRRILAARDAGCAVLLSSLDLDEVKLLSDRIVVMSGGAVRGSVDREDATDERLGLLMAGGGS